MTSKVNALTTTPNLGFGGIGRLRPNFQRVNIHYLKEDLLFTFFPYFSPQSLVSLFGSHFTGQYVVLDGNATTEVTALIVGIALVLKVIQVRKKMNWQQGRCP